MEIFYCILTSYIFIGMLVVLLGAKRGVLGRQDWFLRYTLSFLIWPLFVLLMFQEMFSSDKKSNRFYATIEISRRNLEISRNKFQQAELEQTINDLARSKLTEFEWYSSIKDSIEALWDIDLHPNLYNAYYSAKIRFEQKVAENKVHYQLVKKEPNWFFGMTDGFIKSLRKVDRKMQGRILDALKEITDDPMKVIGDTLKPLTGELDGLWRYRLGDYRLIFQPDPKSHNVLLLSFSSRGSAYN